MQDRRPLASYFFDEPQQGLGKWMDHKGKSVFVPNFPKWLTPDNKPEKQAFHYQDTKDWKPGEWGYSKNIYDRIRIARENRRILDDCQARGVEPEPGSTTHLPGMPWRASDNGFSPERNEWKSLARQAKFDKVKQYLKLIKDSRKALTDYVVTNRSHFDAQGQELIGILETVDRDFNGYQTVVDLSKKRYDTTDLTGKARREVLSRMNKAVHSMKVHVHPDFRVRWMGYMQTMKRATDALGIRNFMGGSMPGGDGQDMYHYYVLMAMCGTARQQLMRILAAKFASDMFVTSYVGNYLKVEDYMAQLKSLTSPVRIGSRYRKPAPERYEDSDQLDEWFKKHDPSVFDPPIAK